MIEMLRFLGNNLGDIFEIRYKLFLFGGYDFVIIFERNFETLKDISKINLSFYFVNKIEYI